jgi:TetR/AcrR family transcriptional repressor of nem operon
MARTKEYDRDKLLSLATDTFLERGYKGTSMNDLVEVTGVHRRSLYNEFEGKDGLFLACIDTYLNDTNELFEILLEEPQGIQNIEKFFRDRIAYASSNDGKGCLIVNSTVEREMLSDIIEKKVLSCLKNMENALYKCLQAAEKNDELSSGTDCKDSAKYLMCFLEGLMVMSKTKPSKKVLESVLKSVLSAL